MYSDESDLVLEIRNPQAHLPRSQLPSHGVCVPVPLPLSRSQLPSHGVRGSESGSALGETPGAIYCSQKAAGTLTAEVIKAPGLHTGLSDELAAMETAGSQESAASASAI